MERRSAGSLAAAPPAAEYVRVRQARAKLERAKVRAAAEKAAARKGPGPVRDITDPDARLMPTRNGFIQGWATTPRT